MNRYNRTQILAAIAIAAFALFAADRLLITPLIAAWDQRSDRLKTLKQSVIQGRALLDRQSLIRARWDAMRAQALPSQVSTAEDLVLKSFDRWAERSRASVGSIRPQWKSISPDLTTLECRADVSGNLGSLARFLYELENDPLPLRIELLELTPVDKLGQQLTLTLLVSALSIPPPAKP